MSRPSEILANAYFNGKEIGKLTDAGKFSIPEAYAIQDELIERLIARGDHCIGYKMGLTSKAKMEQVGVHEPIYGVLTKKMQLADASALELKTRIHPKIEPEVAFIIGKELRGKVSPETALAHCSGVCAAMEIIDSRFLNFDFTLPDVIADNCSASGFVLGQTIRNPKELDLANLGIVMEPFELSSDTIFKNSSPQYASSAAVLGNPAASLAYLAAVLDGRNRSLKPGDIVLSGGATAAITLEPGMRIRTSIQDLGSLTVSTH